MEKCRWGNVEEEIQDRVSGKTTGETDIQVRDVTIRDYRFIKNSV